MFLVSAPVGLFGTVWAYFMLHDIGIRKRARMDWWGNILFAVGLIAILVGITYGLLPYGGHPMGWTNPWVLTAIFGGAAIHLQENGVDLGGKSTPDSQLFGMLDQMPWATVTSVVVMLLVAIFFVSGADAASIVMGTLSERGTLEPSRWSWSSGVSPPVASPR